MELRKVEDGRRQLLRRWKECGRLVLKTKCPGYTRMGRRIPLFLTLVGLVLFFVSACGPKAATPTKESGISLSLSSPAFKEGDNIPVKYTCDGQDISPPLAWGEPPRETRAFALIADDPDAPGGVFTHWVLFNFPADCRQLPEAIPPKEKLEHGALQGKNDFGKIGYGGPCPPRGSAHRYLFTLYALDKPLDLGSSASKKQLLEAMKGHILAQGQLTGNYRR